MRTVQPHPDNLGFLVSDVARLLRRNFQQRLAGSSLTPGQSRALVFVSRHEGIRQVELAELLEIQPITIGRLVDQLGAAGLVERREDPTDRRAYKLYTLPAAAPHMDAIHAVAATIRADALRDLDEEEAQVVMAALRTIHRNLSAR